MNNKRTIIIVSSIVFIIILIAIMMASFLNQVKYVYFCTEMIIATEKISMDKIERKMIPLWFYQDDMISELDQVSNMYVRYNTTLYPNMMVTKSMLMNEDELKNSTKYRLDVDEVVFTVTSDKLRNLKGLLILDQYLDIYVTISNRNQPVVVDWLFKNVKIIGLKDKNGKELSKNDNTNLYLINLAINEELLPYLIKAQKSGEIELIIANNHLKQTEFNHSSLLLQYLQ